MELSYKEAINRALCDAFTNNESVVLLGEDDIHNLYGYTEGLYDKFGPNRVIDVPLSEAGVVGMACGAAACGLHPIVDLTVSNFLYVAMDQIASIVAKMTYMNNGQISIPITIFSSCTSRGGNASQHSDRLHSLFMNIPGLKIICPATPLDMYCMLREAIEDENPVLCFADRTLFWSSEEVNDLNDLVLSGNIGKAKVVKSGNDVTIVSISACLPIVKEIDAELSTKGISTEIIDIRSLVPLDFETIKESILKTGRLVICDTACKTGSAASEIASLASQYAFNYLKAPIAVAAAEDIPVPFAKQLEGEVLVSRQKVYNAVMKVMGRIE